ncbi:hypothetical protein F4780DRAFT_121652 [Xylariomycetidae sp. FL0641]|nr:hypothetical protein F4780DRAFT_121652 [Xylariomycetidae sp. FL0641]
MMMEFRGAKGLSGCVVLVGVVLRLRLQSGQRDCLFLRVPVSLFLGFIAKVFTPVESQCQAGAVRPCTRNSPATLPDLSRACKHRVQLRNHRDNIHDKEDDPALPGDVCDQVGWNGRSPSQEFGRWILKPGYRSANEK